MIDRSAELQTKSANEHQGGSTALVIAGACVLVAGLAISDFRAWLWMYDGWTTNQDNSHGMLVPFFSIWLLWHRRDLLGSKLEPISWTAILAGVFLVLVGAAIRSAGIYTRTITLEAVSVVPSIAGIIVCCGGWQAARWTWPSVAFLVFMVPLPGFLGQLLSAHLQRIATIMSTYFLQIIGIPAVSEGNVIWLTDQSVGVAEACSGIRMLMTFFALAVGVSFVISRPFWEKLLIVLSAPVVAILSNVLRITATALAYEFGSKKIAELIFHDLAGWLMMPVGLLMLWFELYLLSRVFQTAEDDRLQLGSIGT